MTIQQNTALAALRQVDFDWTMHMQSVWRDSAYDVSALHQTYRHKTIEELLRLQRTTEVKSPLGMILVGSAGAGKTHLLSALRQYSLSHDIGFVLVDMTDVHDFWATVLQGYVDSLQQTEADGMPQFHKLLDFLIVETKAAFTRTHLAQAERRHVGWYINEMLNALNKRHRREVIKHQDVIRALVLLNSEDFTIANLGYSWLLGMGADEGISTDLGFTNNTVADPSKIIEGLSWLMSLRAPTLLALDQLDSIVSQHYLASGIGTASEAVDEERVSKAIIEGISGGLLGLRDKTLRTLSLVACLEETWNILSTKVSAPVKGRFHEPLILTKLLAKETAQQLVARRLQEAYQCAGFVPPYPTWPFAANFFVEAAELYPRRVLQRCHKHRENCIARNQVWELDTIQESTDGKPPTAPSLDAIDQAFLVAQTKFQTDSLSSEENEDEQFATLLQLAGLCLIIENPAGSEIDALLDTNFAGGKQTRPLHARVRLAYRIERDRERHLCLRALQRTAAIAYQNRLKAAMTMSGIDRALGFRRLLVVRTHELPSGKKTVELTKQFQDTGGRIVFPTETELRVLGALQQLQQQGHADFAEWLRQRRPVSQLPFLREAVAWLFKNIDLPSSEPPALNGITATITRPVNETENRTGAQPTEQPLSLLPSQASRLPVGQHLISGRLHETITIPVEELVKHTVILAGSGSGKTVLVKRLVEEAALLGIPSIVIDGANDLARLGDPWPTPPENWQPEDQAKAQLYHQQSQVMVWTPGLAAGNPLNLEPLPDLAAVVNDQSELDQAVDMARDALQEIVAPGMGNSASLKRGILRSALLYFARHGGGQLTDFIGLLADLPAEAGGNISNAARRAQEMADSLRAEMLSNPLLRIHGVALDPALLFGVDGVRQQTRISVINLSGLMGLAAQQQFLNQLAMTLFTWIKKNPAPSVQPIRGLLVIDEAKDFVPSLGATACKANLLRLVAQARKYGLGLIFATQAPRSIDHNIIANCTIQFYGRANSPAAIEVVQEQLRLRGGAGQDVARLERGQFYATAESVNPPVKVQAPLCLSYHAPTPLDEGEVLARARASTRPDFIPL
ncbi:MAG: helicase HerA domain-containing protein [Caldilineaceae bacterium]